MSNTPYKLPYDALESLEANSAWGANCGPHSIAAYCHVHLETVRLAMPAPFKRWMNPSNISETLRYLRVQSDLASCAKKMQRPPDSLRAIMRIQWEGSWLKPGVPAKAAYCHTHYIAVLPGALVMDTFQDPSIVQPWEAWQTGLEAAIREHMPKVTGWHFTHVWTPRGWTA